MSESLIYVSRYDLRSMKPDAFATLVAELANLHAVALLLRELPDDKLELLFRDEYSVKHSLEQMRTKTAKAESKQLKARYAKPKAKTGGNPGGPRSKSALEADDNAVLNAVTMAPGASLAMIQERTSLSPKAIKATLRRLVRAKRVKVEGKTKNARYTSTNAAAKIDAPEAAAAE